MGVHRFWARLRPVVVPVVLFLAIALPHIDQGAFRTDTGRYGAIGLEAVTRLLAGDLGSFFTLHAPPGEVYFNKPPLGIWIHGFVLKLLGPEVWAARLPTLFAAAVCVGLTVSIARRLTSAQLGLVAGLLLAMTYEFFRRVREISLDMWQLLFVLAAMWFVVRAVRSGKASWAVACGVPIGLALMTKPLVGLVALPILAGWAAWRGGMRIGAATLGGVVPALVVGLPWHLAMHVIHGDLFLDLYFGREIASRAAGEMETDPWWYYAPVLASSAPFLLGLVFSCVQWKRGRLRREAVDLVSLGLFWSGVWLLLISLFSDKSPRYALLVHPGVALAAAPGVVWAVHGLSRSLARRAGVLAAPVAAVAGLVFALAPVRVQPGPHERWTGLFAWLRDNNVEQAWVGGDDVVGMGYPKAARVYLELGWWPKMPEGRAFESGDVQLYHTPRARQWMRPEEQIVYEAGELFITVWAPDQNRSEPSSDGVISGG